MASFSVSPAVLVNEVDLSATVSAVSTSIGALVAGDLEWGPVDEISLISSESELVTKFGRPTAVNYKDFFTAANFLSYSSALKLIRVVNDAARNATATINTDTPAPGTGQLIKNRADYDTAGLTEFIGAKYPGIKGNNLKLIGADSLNFATRTFTLDVEDIPGAPINISDYFDIATPSDTELYLIVTHKDPISKTEIIVETHIVSITENAKNASGQNYYFDTYLANNSKWLWGNYDFLVTNSPSFDWATDFELGGGLDGTDVAAAERNLGLAIFTASTEVDINLLMTGGADATTINYAIQNVAEVRRDCVAFVSPSNQADLINATDPTDMINTKIADNVPSSSYAMMDGNYKYQYDKYFDVYRWVPLNGDIAGLCAKTDDIADPWFSPAGFNRGQIKGVVKLAFQPNKTHRDEMYKNNINPIAAFPGEGVVLYGDKTLQAKASSFQFINVRRLFITLEKAISTSSKYVLFEYNDFQTRNIFKNMVEPFLRRVKGRRGIYDFRVICDDSNNTGDVIDAGEFVADIYVQPSRSIQVVQLNFINTKSGVSFEEVIGEA